jgi:hypothetical protein
MSDTEPAPQYSITIYNTMVKFAMNNTVVTFVAQEEFNAL